MEIQTHTTWQLCQQFTKAGSGVYCNLYMDEANKMGVDEWIGAFGKQENFQNALLGVLEELKKYKVRRWLADLSGMQGGFKGSEQWVREHVVPELEKHGLRSHAIVLSKDIYSKLSTADALKKIQEVAAQQSMKVGKLEIKHFTDRQAAIDWLKSRP